MKISIDKDTCAVVTKEDKRGVKQTYLVDPFRVGSDFVTPDTNRKDYLYNIVYNCAEVLTNSDYGMIPKQYDNTEDNPFFVLLERIECVFTYRVGTLATNDEYMFINPSFWADLYGNSKKWCTERGWDVSRSNNSAVNVNTSRAICCNLYVFIHELMHCLLDHIREHRVLREKYPDQKRANIAMDYVCNHNIEEMFPDLRGVGNFINACYDLNRGEGHWIYEYDREASITPPDDPNGGGPDNWSDDKKRGFKDTIREIRELFGRVRDNISDRAAAYHKIMQIYGPDLQRLKGINLADILNESVVDNLTKISDDYDEGVIEALKSALDDLSTPTCQGDSDDQQNGSAPSANIVDRDNYSDSNSDSNDGGDSDGSDSDGDDSGGNGDQNSNSGSNSSSNKKGSSASNSQQPTTKPGTSWDAADQIQKEMGKDKGEDNGSIDDGTQPGESELSKKLSKMMDAQRIHNIIKDPGGATEAEKTKVSALIKSLGNNDWTSYLSTFISDYIFKRFDGRLKTRYETLGGDVVLYRKRREKVETMRHITIILDTSGSVMSTPGAYQYFVSEIGQVLESIKSQYDILVDFLTFGTNTYFTRFIHKPGTFLSDTKKNKCFTFGANGTTDYEESFALAHLLMNDESTWSDFKYKKDVDNLIKMVDEENQKNNIIDDEYGPSGVTICFTDSDFAWGDKYRGDGFSDPNKASEFRSQMCIFMVLDGGEKDMKCINPTSSTNVLSYRNPLDKKFGWNIQFVSSDCIKERLTEGALGDIDDDDDTFLGDKESISKIENMYGDVKTADEEYIGNITLCSMMKQYNDVTCNVQDDNTVIIKSLRDDRTIDPEVFIKIASITDKTKYALDGYLYIRGNIVGSTASDSDVNDSTDIVLSKLPYEFINHSAIIIEKCHDMTPQLYSAIQKQCGAEHVAYLNCKKLCKGYGEFSDHPITTVDYILNYMNKDFRKDIEDEVDFKIYAVNQNGSYAVIDPKNYIFEQWWNDKVGVFLVALLADLGIDVNIQETSKAAFIKDNTEYGFDYVGIPPFIKFVGTDGRVVFYYRQKQINGWSTEKSLKGSMCVYNRIVPIAPNKLKEEKGDIGTKKGIYLMNETTNNMAYIFLD